jgi:GNAT superfamily N-acetyltransferase
MRIDATVSSPVIRTFRVDQVAAMFDVPLAERASNTFSVEVPDPSEPWDVGVIVGPSGSGKSTIAAKAFAGSIYRDAVWPERKSFLEGFPDGAATRDITGTLTAVGFSSPPDWVKPYGVLSNGQRFRADLARALLSDHELVVFDEFTSVVDRTVAKVGSAAVSRSIRSGKIKRRFVAVTCHYDVVDWLEPCWVVDMATQSLARGLLHRPPITIEIVRCHRDAWSLFKHHHYLTGDLHVSCQCYMATWNGLPVAFCAMLNTFGYKDYMRVSRIVTLPDYQGVGIGVALMEWCCQHYLDLKKRVSIVGTHPAIIRHCERSQSWRLSDIKRCGKRWNGTDDSPRSTGHTRAVATSSGRAVASFEYVGGRHSVVAA